MIWWTLLDHILPTSQVNEKYQKHNQIFSSRKKEKCVTTTLRNKN